MRGEVRAALDLPVGPHRTELGSTFEEFGFAKETRSVDPQVWPSKQQWGSDSLKLVVDEMTGSAFGHLPLPISPGRNGFTPQHGLVYESGVGNGAFGLGWRLDVPIIERRTTIETPRYRDEEGQEDTFLFNGDELVPALRKGESWTTDRTTVGDYLVQRFRRRHETTFDRIERWTHEPSGDIYWKVTDVSNVTSLFGNAEINRVALRSEPTKVGAWLLAERFDDRGNVIQYDYRREDLDNVYFDVAHERHRLNVDNPQGAWRYLKRISYGNDAPHSREAWHFHVVFDYGDHDHDNPKVDPSQSWDERPDPFSSTRMGFENRQWRRCRRVLMFHRFDQFGEEPRLVSSIGFTYDAARGQSLLTAVTKTGFIDRDGKIERESLAPISLGYDASRLDAQINTLDSEVLLNTLSDPSNQARWVDFYREGLPGVVIRQGDAWHYIRNLGNGRFADPDPVADVGFEVSSEDFDLSFVERPAHVAHVAEYTPTTTLRTSADPSGDDQYIGYLDVNGDGTDDVIVADDQVLRWYPSRAGEGFGDPVVLKLDPLDHAHAHRLHREAAQSIHVADMTGDGCLDIVRVRANDIAYWPNQGRGRFGAMIQMTNAPAMVEDAGRRTFVADMTGSGTADLVSIGDGEVMVWENYNGNGWGKARIVSAPGIHPDSHGLAVLDLMGNGSASIIWVDQSNNPEVLRHVAPFGGATPRFLVSAANGQGLETRIEYRSSTESWLTDRKNGLSWLNLLPYPKAVVNRVEERDGTTGSRRLTRFAYHHSHFDEDSQSLIGFAFTERWDGGTYEHYEEKGLFPELVVPALEKRQIPAIVLTKTWRHTGAIFEDAELTSVLKDGFYEDSNLGRRRWLTGPQMPRGQKEREIPLSHAAMAGRLLRQEVFVLDGPPFEDKPLNVVEQTAWVRQLQPVRGGTPPAYEVVDYETVEAIYERDAANPRVSHRLSLELGDHGQIAKWAEINYPPRQVLHDGHRRPQVLVHETTTYALVDSPSVYRASVPVETKTWRLAPLGGKPDRLYEARQVLSALEEQTLVDPIVSVINGDADNSRRIVAQKRWRYWSNDGRRLLPIGTVESRALLAREEDLALTASAVEEIYGKSALEPFRFEGGYFADDANWWAPGCTVSYDASLFYLPVTQLDALGRETKVTWDDAGLFVIRREDGFGNSTFLDWHPRTLKVWRSADANSNVMACRFTALGNVLSVANVGSEANKTGDSLDMSVIESSAKDNPTAVYTYNFGAWLEQRQAVSVRERHRLVHGGRPTSLRDRFTYRDGRGATLSKATRHDKSWMIDELVLHDAFGRISGSVVPFVSDTSYVALADRKDLAATTWSLDACNRITRRDNADGTFVLKQFEAWRLTEHDESDTVLDSTWYAERSSAGRGRAGDFAKRQAAGATEAMRAAAMSAAHARTPETHVLDVCGRPYLRHQQPATGTIIETATGFDHEGRIESQIDGRGIQSHSFIRDLIGRVIVENTADGGEVVISWSATGEELQRVDPEKRRIRRRYDTVGRLTHVLVGKEGEPEIVRERFIWGGGDVAILHAAERNLIGRLHMRLSPLGVETFDNFDAHGLSEKTTLRLLEDHDSAEDVDWSLVNDVSHLEQMLVQFPTLKNLQLAQDELVLFQQSDATGRVTAIRGFNRVQLQFDRRVVDGAVAGVKVSADGNFGKRQVVSGVDYSAIGKPSEIRLGNGVEISRAYDAAGRQTNLVATGHDEEVIQELMTTYDAMGNPMSVSQRHEVTDAFSYDGIGRLVGAEGYAPVIKNGQSERERYARRYELDANGNLLRTVLTGKGAEVLSENEIAPNANRILVNKQLAQDVVKELRYDPSGNMVSDGDSCLRWDENNRLIEVSGPGGGRVTYSYDRQATLRRRVVSADNERQETVFIGPFERHRVVKGDEVVKESYRVTASVAGIPLAVGERVLVDSAEGTTSGVHYVLVDHVGSAVHSLDDNAKILSTHTYSPFGVSNEEDGDKTALRIGFRSGEHDHASNLVRIKTRWYSPGLGTWVQVDRSKANGYLFKNANPQRIKSAGSAP